MNNNAIVRDIFCYEPEILCIWCYIVIFPDQPMLMRRLDVRL